MPNSPSLTRITVFPSSHSGSVSPAAHEVSVAITTVPVISNRPPTAQTTTLQSHNVIISEVADESIAEADEVDFSNRTTRLSRKNSTVSESADISSPHRHASQDVSLSAPSTLTKSKPEPKTGEVYV